MEPTTIIAGTQAIASGAGQIFGNRARKKEAELAYKRGIKFWHMQNKYNSPIEQMERFKAAGLNPNLIYGQGTAGNSSSSVQYNPSDQRDVEPQLSGALSTALANRDFNLRQSQVNAEIDNVRAQTELTKARVNTEAVNQALKALGKDKLATDLEKARAIMPYQLKVAENEAEASNYLTQERVTKIAKMGQEQALNLLEQEYVKRKTTLAEQQNLNAIADWVYKNRTNELRALGISEKDPAWLKLLGLVAGDKIVGSTPAEKGKSLWDWIRFHWSF